MSLINLFNSNTLNFLDDLDKIINDNYYSKLISEKKQNINNVLLFKNDILLEVFNNNIYKYKDKILKEDSNILNDIGSLDMFVGLNIIDIVNKMSCENKIIFWKYLKTFVLLCEKYYYTL